MLNLAVEHAISLFLSRRKLKLRSLRSLCGKNLKKDTLSLIGTPGRNGHQSRSCLGSGEFSECVFTFSVVQLKLGLYIILVLFLEEQFCNR